MTVYPRFTPAERRKLTMSARARESFKAVGIRGGAGPGEGAPPAPSAGEPNYYGLSEDDRALFERVIADNNSSDPVKKQQAGLWWRNALKTVLPRAAAPFITGNGGFVDKVLDFWGYKVYQGFNITEEACESSTSAAVITGASLRAGAGNQVHVGYNVGYTPLRWECLAVAHPVTLQPAIRFHVDGVNIRVRDDPFADFGVQTAHGGATFWVEGTYDDFGGTAACLPPADALAENSGGAAQEFSNSFDTSELPADKCMVVEIGVPSGWACARRVCRGEDLSWPPYEPVGGPSLAPPDAPSDIPVNPCDMIPPLRDYPYAPPPGSPPGLPPGGLPPDGNPVDPGTGLPPGELPTQPPDPGTNPFPGQPPTDVPPGTGDPGLPPGDPGLPVPDVVPPGAVVPETDPIDSGIEDPASGGCMKLAGEPAGFRDPNQAGGIARKYQPGQPMVIDYGEGSPCKTKIVKVKPDPAVPEICVAGGIDNSGAITDKTCYGPGPVEDAIRSVLGDMVAEGGNIIFDSDCARELHRPLCFRAGTLKRVILNKLLDMCGFCVFPLFDCNVIVGYCGPTSTVWTYHEDVDLRKFDLEYDGQEIFDYVEVFRGDWISRAGNVFVRGNSVLYPVGSSASSVSGDRVYQYEVPYSTPDSELNSIAITLAAKLRSQALPEIAFGVPLNSQMNLRHQLRIQMPSVGFDAYYMITRLARDYDRENGHLSTGLARWLHAA